MSETQFEALFRRYGKSAYLHKLTDTAEVSGLNGRLSKTKEQPADYLVCLNGDMFLAEVKGSVNKTSFPFGNIRSGQLAHARRLLAAGGRYWFFILRNQNSEWFRVPAQVVLDWPRSSMKWAELSPYRFGV